LDALRNIDLNLLIIFEAIYSSGNITAASRKLGVSQPTISNSLARLRDSIGDQLFVREGRGVKPTPRADLLIVSVRQALSLIEGGISSASEFDPSADKRHFRIAILDLLEPVIMPALIREVQEQGNITFEALPASNGKALTQGLNDGSIELIIADYQPQINETDCKVLGTVESVAIVRKGHPVIDGVLTREQFSTLGHVGMVPALRNRIRMSEVMERLKIQRKVIYQVTRFWSFPHIVANTDLIGMAPAGFAKVMAKQYPLQILQLPFTIPDEQSFYMTWKNSNTEERHHTWLRDKISEIYSSIQTEDEPA
jgi:DNA-binding transcriptional LysR family regulator